MERIADWEALRVEALVSTRRTRTGAELRYRRTTETISALTRLVDAENSCCARGQIRWDLVEADDHLCVTITVPSDLAESPELEPIYAFLLDGLTP